MLKQNKQKIIFLLFYKNYYTKCLSKDQGDFIPPINVLAYGTFPLNYALLKSKPGCSSLNLYSIIFFFSSSYYRGFKFL
jgi:hypothetical protein